MTIVVDTDTRSKTYGKAYRKKGRRKRKTNAQKLKTYVPPTAALNIKRPIANSQQVVKLRYFDFLKFDPGLGTIAYDTYTMNSLQDPYTPVGGHRPMGTAEWQPFYQHFLILKSVAYIRFTSAATDAAGLPESMYVYAGLKPGSGNVGTTMNNIIEQGKFSYKVLTGATGSHSSVTLRKTYNPKTFFGIKNPSDEHDLRGSIGASDPTEKAYLEVGCGSVDNAINPSQVYCGITIVYTALLTERKMLSQSA